MKPELLAPVGSPASLRAAVESGADAVYMGSLWNARVRARNFSRDELARAVAYCHKNNVKAYITLNTLIFETEMPQVADYIRTIYEIGADALIMQDLGVAKMARAIAPDLPIHASTQLSTHNSKTAKFLKRLGFSRLILAREVSFEQAKAIQENAEVEIETFAHGAMCYSYSGKCFFSLLQTDRSANRGACSQMCRFPWKLFVNNKFVKNGYLTSLKDMNTLSHISEMEKYGISCVKIEGRLKDATYIRGVVSAYRKAIDSGSHANLDKFSTRGYSSGYLTGEAKRAKLTNPSASSFSGEIIGKVISNNRNGAQIRLTSTLSVGDSLRSSSSGKIVEIFRMSRQGREVKSSNDECTLLIKTLRPGDKLYKVVRAKIEDESVLSSAPLLRKLSTAYKFESKKLDFPPLALTYICTGNAPNVVPFDYAKISSDMVVDTPRVAFDSELPIFEEKMREIAEKRPLAFMVSEPSLMSDYPAVLSPYANVTNTLAVRAWQEFGNVRAAIPSLEIIRADKFNASLGFSTYTGYPEELMISENDLFFELGVQEGKGKVEIEDPRGNRFEIVRVGGRTVVLKGKSAPPKPEAKAPAKSAHSAHHKCTGKCGHRH